MPDSRATRLVDAMALRGTRDASAMRRVSTLAFYILLATLLQFGLHRPSQAESQYLTRIPHRRINRRRQRISFTRVAVRVALGDG